MTPAGANGTDSAVTIVQTMLDAARARASAGGQSGQRFVGSANTATGFSVAMPITATVTGAEPGSVPDYFPPFQPGAALADRDGNLWILPLTSRLAQAGSIAYDIVNPAAGLVERVQLPEGRSVAGFGPGGVVYLAWRDESRQWHLERTRMVR